MAVRYVRRADKRDLEAFRMEVFHRFLEISNNFETGRNFLRKECGVCSCMDP